jgi:hypothetical protein
MQKADRGRIEFLQVFLRAVELFSRVEYLDIISLEMGDFFYLKKSCLFTTASSAAPQIPLCWRMVDIRPR